MAQRDQGLEEKFNVTRVDGRDQPGGDRAGAKYFVLDLTYDRYALSALAAYASACKFEYPVLAADLHRLVHGIADEE